MQRQILRYITLACSVFCEYLAGDNSRLQRAAFSAMRLILSHGLKPWLLKDLGGTKKKKDDMLELLKFDALTLSEEVKNVRDSAGGGFSQMTPQDKIVIHMCYLLTNRFEHVHSLVLKLVKTFIEQAGTGLKEQQRTEFLLVVSQLKISGRDYNTWADCLGTFMRVMGAE